MNQDVKEKWLTALRSGEYRQGTGALKDSTRNAYCCLGVLCEIAVKDGVIQPPLYGPIDVAWLYGHELGPEECRSGSLPRPVYEWAGLSNSDPNVHGWVLSEWNDVKNADFKQIAKMIEEEL